MQVKCLAYSVTCEGVTHLIGRDVRNQHQRLMRRLGRNGFPRQELADRVVRDRLEVLVTQPHDEERVGFQDADHLGRFPP